MAAQICWSGTFQRMNPNMLHPAVRVVRCQQHSPGQRGVGTKQVPEPLCFMENAKHWVRIRPCSSRECSLPALHPPPTPALHPATGGLRQLLWRPLQGAELIRPLTAALEPPGRGATHTEYRLSLASLTPRRALFQACCHGVPAAPLASPDPDDGLHLPRSSGDRCRPIGWDSTRHRRVSGPAPGQHFGSQHRALLAVQMLTSAFPSL